VKLTAKVVDFLAETYRTSLKNHRLLFNFGLCSTTSMPLVNRVLSMGSILLRHLFTPQHKCHSWIEFIEMGAFYLDIASARKGLHSEEAWIMIHIIYNMYIDRYEAAEHHCFLFSGRKVVYSSRELVRVHGTYRDRPYSSPGSFTNLRRHLTNTNDKWLLTNWHTPSSEAFIPPSTARLYNISLREWGIEILFPLQLGIVL
jgi:hypothetical protein